MHNLIGFAESLLKWYIINKRELPWRNTNDPFKIWVSEIILQQTRVQQGLPYYERFIENYPSVEDLANAPLKEILRLWQGLGYYSRARNMHFTSQYILNELGGKFPTNFEDLLMLKGVGRYTAAAIASFAYNEKVPVVDGNVQRVLSRIFGISEDISSQKTQKLFETIAANHISSSEPGTFNQAIMEFGSQYCLPGKPDCESCVFKEVCFANKNNLVGSLPVKLKKTKVRDRYLQYIIFKLGEELALKQRNEKDIWKGLFDFYLLESNKELTETAIYSHLTDKGLRNVKISKVSESLLHILSHQRLHVTFFEVPIIQKHQVESLGLQFYSKEKIEQLAKPVLMLRYLKQTDFF